MTYRIRHDCRLCASPDLVPVLLLEPTPLANEFMPADFTGEQEKFPLYLVECRQCKHVQLPVVVDPERLFRNYVYVSGTSPSFVEHFRKYAESMIEQHGLKPGDLVVEIGSNDGTLLKFFKAAGMRVLGIDPARKIAEQAREAGIPTLSVFFDSYVGYDILERSGPARLVIANNVFAHADNLKEIVAGVRTLLHDAGGAFVFEVQSLVDLMSGSLFDMIYHEHLSYHSIAPLLRFFGSRGMDLTDAEHVATHGGSLRCTVRCGTHQPSAALGKILREELETLDGDPWAHMRWRVNEAAQDLRDLMMISGVRFAGYGAPAKLTTLLHQLRVQPGQIAYVVDDSPWKQGLLTPGHKIPVVPSSRLAEDPPDAVIIFAWNFAEQIAEKILAGGFTGKIFTPLPTLMEIA